MPAWFSKILSAGSDKGLKEFNRIVDRINELNERYREMDDAQLEACTANFRERREQGETLDELLPEAFAVVREAAGRAINMRHFDVQLLGGIALHRGMIAEMKTGEGKTLVSTLAGYLNALDGKGVHIITVNDYLARRDCEWMGAVYNRLGMHAALIQNGMKPAQRMPAYQADITYGTNSEFGFDYLRDNMVTNPSMRVQRGHAYAVVDEVDSILIDEARTPLIISGAGSRSASIYKDFARAVRGLTAEVDFEMDEAKHTIAATEEGLAKIEARLGCDIYGDMSAQLVNNLQQALKAEYMFHRDQQYVVIDHEVKIVDEFTGRIMEGRRYSEGLHQAIEAKEGVPILQENQTLATITLQNYFRLYDKLAGMTGTALTEDSEFREIYNLDVQVIPTNKPFVREDLDDLIYRTIDAKFAAVADEVAERHAQGQPCLVGTVSIESSERLSRILNKRGIAHNVLNAKQHAREAQIIAQAGREGAVTIATNMAGRGTDILLGGNYEQLALDMVIQQGYDPEDIPEDALLAAQEKAKKICEVEREHVLAAGGLAVIGTERHESRRIDNQLRGRSGRQGDPGVTQFYLSLEDDLMRLFAGDRMDKIADMMARANIPDDVPIQAKMVTKAVESAQHKVEQINFSRRKNVLDYDNVMDVQRRAVYDERNRILDGKDIAEHVSHVLDQVVTKAVESYCPSNAAESERDIEGLKSWLANLTGAQDALQDEGENAPANISHEELLELVRKFVRSRLDEKVSSLGEEMTQKLSAQIMVRVIDTRWMSYLQEMDYLKMGIGLRGFGQRDPLSEYRSEAYAAFTTLRDTMYEDFIRLILRYEPQVLDADQQSSDARVAVSVLERATYSGPADVDGEQADSAARLHVVTGARVVSVQSTQGRASQAQATQSQQQAQGSQKEAPAKPQTFRKDEQDPYAKVGRNDPCPCGSGLKFKKCHGKHA